MANAANFGIHLIQVPYDSGAKDSGMGRGPAHLVACGLEERIRRLGFPTLRSRVELEDRFPTEIATTFAVNRLLADRVRAALPSGFPLILSGNCNSCVGIIAGLADADLGVVWFDGHGDFNTPETSLSGFLDGMGLAMATGRCWRVLTHDIPGFSVVPDGNVVLVGARDLDDEEANALETSGIARVDTASIRSIGPAAALTPSLAMIRNRASGAYLHVDLDVLDPREARANHLAPVGGLSIGELVEATREVSRRIQVRAAAIAAYDPECDESGSTASAAAAVVETVVSELNMGQITRAE